MEIRHPLVWMGAAALAAAFFIPMLMQQEEEAAPQAAAEPNYFAFVRSMEGTRPDGELKVAADDRLMLDEGWIRLFDYYLAAVGEKPLDAIHREIGQELDRRLKPGAAAEGKRLLGRYIDYKHALAEAEKNPEIAGPGLDAIRGRLQALQQVRARFFSQEESRALFGFEDAYSEDAVARLEINQDKSLTREQKQARLAALDAALPPALREAREAPLKVARLQEAANKMRAEGASEDDIYRMRASAFSPEAATRMAEVDREESEWKRRIAAYLAERSRLSDAAAIAALRNRLFDVNEQRRLPAYEK